ncbi:uncharacterized protein CG4951-like [Drosophila obscura]|uniref:uncharacterized protein CG4951-like n=1 Tax=Drosophila obscura TaxID=7282 RepID=UPI001BB2AE2F|nr:uncharacterized protein CG4951-like [Drosophila obscura]
MDFNATGKCQIVLQTYQYKMQHIICRITVRPKMVIHCGKKLNTYHWMTLASWIEVESRLWGLFEKQKQQPVQTLHAGLLIGNIKLRVDSTENRHSYSHKLLPGATLSEDDLYLNVQLEFIPPVEATTPMKKGIDSADKVHEFATSKASVHDAQKRKHGRSSHGQGSRENKKTKQTRKAQGSTSEDTEKENYSKRSHSSRENKPTKRKHSSRSIDKNVKRTRKTSKSDKKMHSSQKSIAQYFDKDKASTSGRSSTKRSHKPESEKKKTAKLDSDIVKKGTAKENAININIRALAALANILANAPAPRQVDILLMNEMGKEDVLNTFSKYKSDLDQFFAVHRTFRTDHFMTIQHVHIIDIVKRNISEAMLAKLGEVYGGETSYASLLINALLPLWIVRLFMDTFHFGTAEAAVRQIKDQLAYGTHIKALNNEPLESDLEM